MFSPGAIQVQNWLWFQRWEALLKIPFWATAPARRCRDDVLDGFVLPLGARDQLVAVVDIGLVVEVVVVLQRLLRHAEAGQRVMGIGKIGKGEGQVSPVE